MYWWVCEHEGYYSYLVCQEYYNWPGYQRCRWTGKRHQPHQLHLKPPFSHPVSPTQCVFRRGSAPHCRCGRHMAHVNWFPGLVVVRVINCLSIFKGKVFNPKSPMYYKYKDNSINTLVDCTLLDISLTPPSFLNKSPHIIHAHTPPMFPRSLKPHLPTWLHLHHRLKYP